MRESESESQSEWEREAGHDREEPPPNPHPSPSRAAHLCRASSQALGVCSCSLRLLLHRLLILLRLPPFVVARPPLLLRWVSRAGCVRLSTPSLNASLSFSRSRILAR
jgi:hypothetical protein